MRYPRPLETQHIVNADTLILAMHGALPINASRGGLVDTEEPLPGGNRMRQRIRRGAAAAE